MRALVTGCGGFSGRALKAYLEANSVDVHCVSARRDIPGAEFVEFGDPNGLASLIERIQPTHIMHLSGAMSADELSEMVTVNILQAAALIDAIRRAGADARLLVVGSAAEYGPLSAAQLPASEELCPRPASAYGVSKLAQTQLALSSGLPVVVVRPSNIVGPGMPRTLALGGFAEQLKAIARGRSEAVLYTGDRSAVRDMIDVADAVRLYWELLNEPAAVGKIVNVATGSGVTIGEALDQLIEACGVQVRVVEEAQPSTRSTAGSTYVANTERLQLLLGPQAFIPLSASMNRIAEHLLAGA